MEAFDCRVDNVWRMSYKSLSKLIQLNSPYIHKHDKIKIRACLLIVWVSARVLFFLLINIRLFKLSVNGMINIFCKLNTRMKCVNIGGQKRKKLWKLYAKTWLNGVINYFSWNDNNIFIRSYLEMIYSDCLSDKYFLWSRVDVFDNVLAPKEKLDSSENIHCAFWRVGVFHDVALKTSFWRVVKSKSSKYQIFDRQSSRFWKFNEI